MENRAFSPGRRAYVHQQSYSGMHNRRLDHMFCDIDGRAVFQNIGSLTEYEAIFTNEVMSWKFGIQLSCLLVLLACSPHLFYRYPGTLDTITYKFDMWLRTVGVEILFVALWHVLRKIEHFLWDILSSCLMVDHDIKADFVDIIIYWNLDLCI